MAPGSGALSLVEALAGTRPPWMADGACREHPDLEFVPRSRPVDRLAVVCAGCLVRQECLDYALERPELVGWWGGTTERQRREVRQRPAA